MMDERRQLKGRNEEQYNVLNRQIHRKCIEAKEIWMNDNCKEIEELGKRDQQLMYEKVKEITYKKKTTTSTGIKKRDGTVVMEADATLQRWTEYIGELFTDDRAETLDVNNSGEDPPIMKAEVQAALKKIKKGKAKGDDGIAGEMLEALDEYGVDLLTEIARQVYENGERVAQMYKSTFITLPKIPGTLECNKHSTISIMSQITKNNFTNGSRCNEE